MPVAQIALLTAIAFAVNLFAAVQDVAVDGMAIDVLPPSERGRANALMAFGQVAGFSSFAALSGVLLNAGGLPTAAVVGTVAIGAVLLLITLTRERRGERMLPWTVGAATNREHAAETTFAGIISGLLRVLFLPMSVLLVLVRAAGANARRDRDQRVSGVRGAEPAFHERRSTRRFRATWAFRLR